MRKLGLYRQDENVPGRWEYRGGVVDPVAGTVAADLTGFSRYAVMAYEWTFPDLLGHWSRAEVEVLASRDMVHGAAGGSFQPDRPITRAEAAQAATAPLHFADAGAVSAWARGYVALAVARGLMRGMTPSAFEPDGSASRAQVAAVVYRTMEMLGRITRRASVEP